MAKVLVLDDDRLSQKLVGRVFGNAGHEVLAAESTQRAWEKLYEHVLVDMVVLDNQLDQEWGWQFMRTLRNNPAYLGLPVVVYTAHTERESIVRYLELGVQSVNMKPYQSEVLLAELAKAERSNWAAKVMEPPEIVCERMNFSMQDYCSLLATANRTIAEKQQVALARLTSPNSGPLHTALDSIDQQCRSVGIAIIGGVIEKIKKGIHEEDIHAALEGFRSVDSFLGMIRHRMLKVMNMGDSVSLTPLPIVRAQAGNVQEAQGPAALFATNYSREIIQKPLWHFGPLLNRVMGHPFVTPDELEGTMKRLNTAAPFATVTETLRTLHALQGMAGDDAVTIAWETRGFVPVYQFILERVTGTVQNLDSIASLSRAAGQQGVGRMSTIAAVARITNSLPRDGVLNLRQLYVHGFTSSLIAFEIGRLFKLQNDYHLSAAGLAHDMGRWLFANGEPGAYALALALSVDDRISPEQAETALFGMDHHQAGKLMLGHMDQPELMQTVAALHHNPSKVANPEHIVPVTVVHIAHILAQAAIVGFSDETKRILAQLREPNYMAWGLMKSRGVELPFETPELVDTLLEVAFTSNWISHQFLSNSDSLHSASSSVNRAAVHAGN